MQEANILFTIHFICYWFMVILYDIDSLIILSNSVKNSLKNQILCTLPFIFIFHIDSCIQNYCGNLGSFVVGIILSQYYGFIFNIYVLYLWSAIATISVCISHSNSKCYLDNGVHLLHHKLLKCNFGTGLYIIDRVCNSHES